MKIVFLEPPGRFPTMTHDLGPAFDILASEKFECAGFNANHNWWKFICSADYVRLLSQKCRLQDGVFEKLSPRATPATMAKLAGRAASSLAAMKEKGNYADAARYAAAVKPFSDYIRVLNYLQPEFRISLSSGPGAGGLDYSSSAALAGYAATDTLLSASVEAALKDFPEDAQACFLYITSPADLLTGLISARIIRSKYPGIYISLLSHAYENFSLDRVAPGLERSGALFGPLDSIVRYSYERDPAALYIARKLADGERPEGFIENVDAEVFPEELAVSQPLDMAFSPETVFWTRLSSKRCYWGRCSFCVQNLKHLDDALTSEEDIKPFMERVSALSRRGCRHYYLCDEAIHPGLLMRLCDEIAARGLRMNWGCRSRIDGGYTPELLGRMKAAGCYEILFGVESVVPRVQLLMNKYERALAEPEIRRVVDMVIAAGMGIHLTFVTCFPGERQEETEATVRFAASVLKDANLATYYFNVFTLYRGSEVYENPDKYGIVTAASRGDLDLPVGYAFADKAGGMEHEKVRMALPGLLAAAEKELGWAGFDARPEYALCRDLYFNYAHGAYIKSRGVDIFKDFRVRSR